MGEQARLAKSSMEQKGLKQDSHGAHGYVCINLKWCPLLGIYLSIPALNSKPQPNTFYRVHIFSTEN